MSSIEYLEDERKKLWEKIIQLESEISKKTSDFEKDAKQSSRKASEFRNRSEEAKDNSQEYADESKTKLEKVKEIYQSLVDYNEEISELYTSSSNKNDSLTEIFESVNSKKTRLDSQIARLEEYFESEDYYIEKIETQESYFEKSEELDGKIETVYKSILNKKKEIDNLNRDIFGYYETIVDEDGLETENHIDGLKDNLENSYNNIEEELENLKIEVTNAKVKTVEDYNTFIEKKSTEFNSSLKKWKNEYKLTLNKINALLPNALTTGLSYAYSEKKKSEVDDSKILAKKFRTATYGLVAVSLIPFIISTISLYDGKSLEEVIINIPRLVLAILPLYIPVLWLAYSSNKKLNLSKRLIEEYTHKEVLSKTFEGLSTQIENIDNVDISSELKTKLLYNILNVSSENPGKLISDYNKSDHPLMDALEKSMKLTDAVDKLSNIPGLTKISNILNNKAKNIVAEQNKKIEKGFETINPNGETD